MTIERGDIDQMAKFMAALQPDALSGPASTVPAGIPPAKGGVSAPAVDEMRKVLERFHRATDNVLSEASYDKPLREALVTEATEQGARIGTWEIRAQRSGRHNVYDVVNLTNGEPLAAGLLLYEAAYGLARILNDGGRINSADAIALLQAEQDYSSRVQDMVLYRHRLQKDGNGPRANIYEARYSDAKRRATQARSRVTNLAEGRA